MTETAEARLKRLSMRSIRRGIKEMDLILSHYADTRLAELSPDALNLYEALLQENDQELYTWVTGQVAPPARFEGLIAAIAKEFEGRKAS